MTTLVIVHGGWGGGWEWTPVAQLLREIGHEVFTPTLTGVGERTHVGSDIRLSDHIDDVLAVFEFEKLRDVVLCGHSYSGMVVTGVADRVPDSIRLLTYLDAFVPEDGQSIEDLVSREFRDVILQVAEEGDDARFPYPDEVAPPEGLVPEQTRASYIARMRPHPIATMTEPVRLSGAVERLPRAFVRCTGGEMADAEADIAPFAARARAAGWPYRESATPHDLHLIDPEGTAATLHDLGTSADPRLDGSAARSQNRG
jgi:pimeloyl-ACP methyl ester carboxylesterase